MKISVLNLLVAAAILASAATQAEQRRQLDAHEHGVVTLNLAVEGQTLFMELRSPAINIVGFEHAPSTDEQEDQIAAEIARLENGANLFAVSSKAGCTLGQVHVDLVRDEDNHEEEHADEGESTAHSEFRADYSFQCTDPDALEKIDVNLFTLYPGIEKIVLASVTPGGQMSQTLSPATSAIVLP